MLLQKLKARIKFSLGQRWKRRVQGFESFAHASSAANWPWIGSFWVDPADRDIERSESLASEVQVQNQAVRLWHRQQSRRLCRHSRLVSGWTIVCLSSVVAECLMIILVILRLVDLGTYESSNQSHEENKPFWLDGTIPMMSFNQSECIIPE